MAAPSDEAAARWRRTLPGDFSWLVCEVLKPGYIFATDRSNTTHGSTNPDDVTVPIVFLGAGIRPGSYNRPIRSVDIAPTLASLLGITPAEPLDGVPLPEITGGSASN